MILEEQAEVARVFIGSKASAWLINSEISNISKETKDSVCIDIDEASKSGVKVLKKNLKKTAKKMKIDPASMYCIYLDWKRSSK